MSSSGTNIAHNVAKKLRSRQASLLRKAEELHLLHNVQVLVLVYHPGKDEFAQYCSCDAQELFFKKVRAEEAGPGVQGSREIVRVTSDEQCEETKWPTQTPYKLVAKPARSKKQPRDIVACLEMKPAKRPAISSYSGEQAGLSTKGSTNGESAFEAAPPWREGREIASGQVSKAEKTAEIPIWTDSDSSSLADLLLDPF